MSNVKILITCSGLGSRLGAITDFTNKSLVRVGNKPVLTRIIESYPSGSKFVITIGHYGDHVKQYLKLSHPSIDVTYVDVDKFEGDGSSLGYSLLKAREHLMCPFIFHACDTLTSKHTDINDQNCIWFSEQRHNTASYRTALTHGSNLKIIQEKGEAGNYVYIGKSFIKDYEEFWNSLTDEYNKSPTSSSLSDCHAINSMILKGHKFIVKNENEWFDIGNIDSLANAKRRFKEDENVLDKFDESIFFVDDNVIKFFHDPKVVESRVQRVNYLMGTTPKVTGMTENFFKYEKFKGEVLSRYNRFNNQIFTDLLSWAHEKLWSQKFDIDIRNIAVDFYLQKTKERIRRYHRERHIEELDISINGHTIQKTDYLIDRAAGFLLDDLHPSLFHGDFILENVLIDKNGNFTLIDWRQDFAGSKDVGDAYYDISKMNHNLIVNHDIINSGNYTINIGKSNVDVDILCSKKFIDARQVIHSFCNKNNFNTKKVDILTSIIWMNMSPLHDRVFGDFLFYFGKYNLMRALDE